MNSNSYVLACKCVLKWETETIPAYSKGFSINDPCFMPYLWSALEAAGFLSLYPQIGFLGLLFILFFIFFNEHDEVSYLWGQCLQLTQFPSDDRALKHFVWFCCCRPKTWTTRKTSRPILYSRGSQFFSLPRTPHEIEHLQGAPSFVSLGINWHNILRYLTEYKINVLDR